MNVAIAGEEGQAEFLLQRSFSGLDDALHRWGREGGERITVPTRTLAGVLTEHLAAADRIDLLDVDCEGHDLTVLQSNDWERFLPMVVLAEWHNGTDVPDYLESLGYRLYAKLGLTGIFIQPQAHS